MCWAGVGKNTGSAYSGWLLFIYSDCNCLGVLGQVEHKEPGACAVFVVKFLSTGGAAPPSPQPSVPMGQILGAWSQSL